MGLMTIRAYLRRKVLWGASIFVVVLFGSLAVAYALAVNHTLNELGVVAIVVVPAVAPVILLFALRCPRCNGPLGSLVAYFGPFSGAAQSIKHCPFCGVCVDERV